MPILENFQAIKIAPYNDTPQLHVIYNPPQGVPPPLADDVPRNYDSSNEGNLIMISVQVIAESWSNATIMTAKP